MKCWKIFVQILLLTLPVAAQEPCLCPNRLAKYECSDGTWSFSEGVDDFIIEGNCQEAIVTGSFDELWVKAGQSCEVQESPIRSTQDISHVSICTNPTVVTLSEFSATSPQRWLQVVLVFALFMLASYGIMLLLYAILHREFWREK